MPTPSPDVPEPSAPSAVQVGTTIRDTRSPHPRPRPADTGAPAPPPRPVVRTACMGCSVLLTAQEHRTHRCSGDQPFLGPRQGGKR